MAIPSKKNINFDVYERQDPKTQVDWGAQASKITKTFEGIRDERQGRKDLLEKNIEEQRVALNDIGEYDSQTLRQVALKSSQQSADELARKADLMRRGIIKPNDLMKFKSNQSAGWTLFKNNAEQWDSKFQELTTRTNDGLNSKAERELAELTSSFGNLKNMSFLTDDDGNMAYARTDDNGNILPGESVSANELTNLLNQKINSYDASTAATAQGKKIGVLVTEMLTENGINATIRSDARSRAESEFFGSDKAKETLSLFAKEMTSKPLNLAVMMVDNNMVNGVQYENNYIGGPADEGDMHAGYSGDASKNPFIRWVWNGNQYVPQVTKEQKTAGDQYAEDLIRATLDIKTGVDVKGMNQARGKTTAEFAADARKKEILSTGVLLNEYVTGDINTANAAGNAIVLKYNKEKDKDAPVMTQFLRVDKKATQLDVDKGYADEVGQDIIGSYDIGIEGMILDPLDAYDEDGNQISVNNAITTLWQEAGLEGDPNDFLNDKDAKIGESLGSGNAGGRGRQKKSKYNRTPVDPVSGEVIDMDDWQAIASKHSGRKIQHLKLKFDDLTASRGFLPPALKNSVKSIESVDGKLVITIGESKTTIDDYENVIGSKNRILIQKIQDTIEKENSRYNEGGKNKIYVG